MPHQTFISLLIRSTAEKLYLSILSVAHYKNVIWFTAHNKHCFNHFWLEREQWIWTLVPCCTCNRYSVEIYDTVKYTTLSRTWLLSQESEDDIYILNKKTKMFGSITSYIPTKEPFMEIFGLETLARQSANSWKVLRCQRADSVSLRETLSWYIIFGKTKDRDSLSLTHHATT